MHLKPELQLPICRETKLAHSTPAFKKLCGLRLFRLTGLEGRILLEHKQVYRRLGKEENLENGQENLPKRPLLIYTSVIDPKYSQQDCTFPLWCQSCRNNKVSIHFFDNPGPNGQSPGPKFRILKNRTKYGEKNLSL